MTCWVSWYFCFNFHETFLLAVCNDSTAYCVIFTDELIYRVHDVFASLLNGRYFTKLRCG